MSKFTYKTTLSSKELSEFNRYLGRSILSFGIEEPSVSLPPFFMVENTGKCLIVINKEDGPPHQYLILYSLYEETPPVVDSGGFSVEHCLENRLSLATSLKGEAAQDSLSENMIFFKYLDDSPVKAFKFYGYRERRGLQEIEPDRELSSIKRYGFDSWPAISVDTIEFLSIEHENGRKTIIQSKNGGFYFHFLVPPGTKNGGGAEFDEDYCYPDAEIVLQHEVVLNCQY